MIVNRIYWTSRIALLIGVVCCLSQLYSCTNNKASASPKTIGTSIEPAHIKTDQANINSRYDVDRYEKFTLSKKLLEISGLTIDTKNDELYAINDEKAILFKLNSKGEILEKLDFGKNGDYEGLEKVDHLIYILKSNGKLIEFDLTISKKRNEYNNPLILANDAEGLAYDHKTNSLLIACKGSPNIESAPKLKKTKAVYAIDLSTKELNRTPFLSITDESIEAYLEKTLPTSISKKKRKKLLSRALDFSPSAIAVHPKSEYFYLLSTLGKTLLLADRNSSIIDIYFLDDSAYIQPEGICFDSEYNMYISNEGKGLKSNIIKIKYKG